jgi:uncharacterized protein YjiS (DUF1127 family)
MYRNLISLFSRRRTDATARLAELDDHLLADIGLTRGDLARIRASRRHPAVRTHE